MGPVATGVLMGIAGTVAMDLFALLLARTGVQPFPNWAMPGRWLAHVFRGRVFHDSIGAAEPVAGELGLGWVFHYAVGIVYGVVFAVVAGAAWRANPDFLPLWSFAILTIAAGWFLLQPGMGMGWAASRAPNPRKARTVGLMSHTAFGLGMYAGALWAV